MHPAPFPDVIEMGGYPLVWVDDPAIDAIWRGDAIFGWRGSSALGMFASPKGKPTPSWDLVERVPSPDGDFFAIVARVPAALDAMQACAFFCEIAAKNDVRRGIDAFAAVNAHNDKVAERHVQDAVDHMVEEEAPRLADRIQRATDRKVKPILVP